MEKKIEKKAFRPRYTHTGIASEVMCECVRLYRRTDDVSIWSCDSLRDELSCIFLVICAILFQKSTDYNIGGAQNGLSTQKRKDWYH